MIGYPLARAEAEMQRKSLRYIITHTAPTRDFFQVDEKELYIIRQSLEGDGVYHFVTAAKMLRKEV